MKLAIMAAALLTGAQDGTVAPDQATYDDLVKCAGVYRAAIAEARTAAVPPDLQTLETGFTELARLYGAPLGADQAQVDARIETAFEAERAPIALARTRASLDAARAELGMEQQICQAVLRRVTADLAAVSGTS